jgi:hypothetical protein
MDCINATAPNECAQRVDYVGRFAGAVLIDAGTKATKSGTAHD